MSRIIRFMLAQLLIATLASTAFAHTVVTRTSDGQNVSVTDMVAAAGSSDVVLIGESHNNKDHHDLQLALIRSLWEQKTPLAIGLEMMQTDSQQALDDWIAGKLSEESFVPIFAKNWGLEWHMYRDIFLFAREHRIPMVALNVPADLVKKVAHHGFAALSEEERKNLPQGTSCDLNNPHTAFLRKTFREVSSHITNQKVFTFFCEAQTLRNSGMALNLARYVKKHPGTRVVGLTGVWHAIKNAIPEQLERNGSKIACTVILPDIPELSLTEAAATQADYMVDQ